MCNNGLICRGTTLQKQSAKIPNSKVDNKTHELLLCGSRTNPPQNLDPFFWQCQDLRSACWCQPPPSRKAFKSARKIGTCVGYDLKVALHLCSWRVKIATVLASLSDPLLLWDNSQRSRFPLEIWNQTKAKIPTELGWSYTHEECSITSSIHTFPNSTLLI